MKHIIVPYGIYQELKNSEYKLDKGITEFNIQEQFDEGVIFFDKDKKYINQEKFEFEDIEISEVMLPRFIWQENLDKLNSFRRLCTIDKNLYEFIDFISEDEKLLKEYKSSIDRNYYNMKFQPRENQKVFIDYLINKIKEGNLRGILKAKPGVGKTFTGITIAQYFKRTLIVVPKSVLVDQWKNEILKFSDLTENDIYILEGSKLDEIEKALTGQYKIIITKPQSILSQIKRLNIHELINLYSNIDLTILDEVHNYGALGYSKVTSLIKSPNVFGLTATPKRRGLNEFLLKNSVGEVIYEADAEVLTPKIQIKVISQNEIEFNEKEMNILNAKKFDYIQFLTFFNMLLTNKNKYFEYLSDWVNYYNYQKHNNVILFNTIKMIKKMEEALKERHPHLSEDILVLTGNSKQDAINIAKEENKILKNKLKEFKEELNQKVKNKELKRKEADELYKKERLKIKELEELNKSKALELYHQKIRDAKIIIGTFGLLKEGFDKPELSHVIFGSPIIGKTTIVQTLGRITRLYEDKNQPIAQFFIHEIFLSQNKNALRIIENNVKGDYKNAEIEYIN